MKATILSFLVFSFFVTSHAVEAQQPYPPRLCNGTWKLQRLQSATGMQEQSPAVEFRLILSPDGRMQQGLYPEGLVQSTWRFDPMRMVLHVQDVNDANAYTLRVVSLRRNELVLQTEELGERMLMYYTLAP